jgi:hypothetical protein
MKTILGVASRMKTIILDGMLGAGTFLFLLTATFNFLIDLNDYLDTSKELEPFIGNFVRTNQFFHHTAFNLFISLLGGMIVGIITYIKRRK